MEHIIPNVPKDILQNILKELILNRDPEAAFVQATDPIEPTPPTFDGGDGTIT